MCNYGPDDVDALNAWAIDAYDFISRAACTQAAPADDGAERVAIDAAQLTGELWRASAEKEMRAMAVFSGERFRGTFPIWLPSVHRGNRYATCPVRRSVIAVLVEERFQRFIR